MLKTCKYCGKVVQESHKCVLKPRYQKSNIKIKKFRNSKEWKCKRNEIRTRDKQLCVYCFSKNRFVYDDIEVHHIIPLVEDFDKRLDDDNLISLCRMCHEDAEKEQIPREELQKLIPPSSVVCFFWVFWNRQCTSVHTNKKYTRVFWKEKERKHEKIRECGDWKIKAIQK